MRVEKDIQKLEEEIKKLKASFAQSASTLKFFSKKETFTTSKRTYSIANSGYFDPLEWNNLISLLEENGTPFVGPYIGHEVIEVVFRSDNGSNVLADLEIEHVKNSYLHIQRVNYSGGAKWVIDVYPNVELIGGVGVYFRWYPTVLNLTLRSIMPGILEVTQL